MRRVDILHVGGDDPSSYPVFEDVDKMIVNAFATQGIECKRVHKISDIACPTIVLGANRLPNEDMIRLSCIKDAIVFQFEQRESIWFKNANYVHLLQSSMVMDYSKYNIEWTETLGIKSAHCKMGFDESLYFSDIKTDKIYDVIFYGSLNERRANVLNQMRNMGLRVCYFFAKPYAERNERLTQSKLAIHIHYYESKIFPPLRVLPIIANAIPILVESGLDRDQEDEYSYLDYAEYDDIAQTAYDMIKDDQFHNWGNKRRFKQNRFDGNLMHALVSLKIL